MIPKDQHNVFHKRYYGNLNPNIEEENLFYENDLELKQKDKILYKYNNEGFRCDDFTKEKNGLHIYLQDVQKLKVLQINLKMYGLMFFIIKLKKLTA